MNETKSLLASKTFWGALIALVATIAQLFAWDIPFADGEQGTIATQLAQLAGTLFAIYGRAAATKKIKPSGQAMQMLAFAFCLLPCAAFTLSGCQTWDQTPESARAAVKAAARTALLIGVDQLSDRVDELEGWRPALEAIIQVSFSEYSEPEEIGAALDRRLADLIADPELQDAVRDHFYRLLIGELEAGTTAGLPPDDHARAFRLTIAEHL